MNPHLKTILEKMFDAVGLKFTEASIQDDHWFWKAEWTAKQEDEFRGWLVRYLKQNRDACDFLMRMPRKEWAEKVADEFIWNYGWKTKREE